MATKKKAEQETPAPEQTGKPKAAKAKPAKEKAAEPETAPAGEEMLQKAAKAIGSAIGTFAAKTGMAHAEPQVSQKIPKLVSKNKQRLPRKAKKLAKKQQLAR